MKRSIPKSKQQRKQKKINKIICEIINLNLKCDRISKAIKPHLVKWKAAPFQAHTAIAISKAKQEVKQAKNLQNL